MRYYNADTADHQMEAAEAEVYDRLGRVKGVDTEMVSDTGTVELMISNGLTLAQVAAGKFTQRQLEDAIVWLD